MYALVIELFAKIGWAYDLKKPKADDILQFRSKMGDGYNNKPHSIVLEYIYGVFLTTLYISIPLCIKFFSLFI